MLAWQHGPGPSSEMYLKRFAVVSDQVQAVLEMLYGEMRAARGLGRKGAAGEKRFWEENRKMNPVPILFL
jgi:hypothetical protein